MAGIDKMYLKNHWEKDEFVVWCIIHKPSLLNNFYSPFEGYDEWDKNKERESQRLGININKISRPITNFRFKQDRYLYWHCPLDFVREYLETQCGYKKANWFVKLFWRY